MGSVRPPTINKSPCEAFAIKLFRQLFKHDKHAALRRLECVFTWLDVYDRGDADVMDSRVRVCKAVRDDVPNPGDLDLEEGVVVRVEQRDGDERVERAFRVEWVEEGEWQIRRLMKEDFGEGEGGGGGCWVRSKM